MLNPSVDGFFNCVNAVSLSAFVSPAVISVVDHEPGHSAVDTDILACNESGIVRAKVQYHGSNIFRLADTAGRLLYGIRTFDIRSCRVYPSG